MTHARETILFAGITWVLKGGSVTKTYATSEFGDDLLLNVSCIEGKWMTSLTVLKEPGLMYAGDDLEKALSGLLERVRIIYMLETIRLHLR